MAVGTPFHSRTSALCRSERWKQWSGYFAAQAFDDFHDPEYHAMRSGAALTDVSPLHKYDIAGPDALRLVDRLVTRDATKCAVGQVMYAAWCDEDGKVLQDGCFQRLGETRFRATAADPALAWFRLNAEGMDVGIDEVSERIAALSLQGPLSRDVLQAVSSRDLRRLRFFRLEEADLGGIPVVVSRTGYTGDLGFEIWVEAGAAEDLWDVLTEAGRGYGLQPAGLLALDRARIEAGFPLIDVDFWNAEKALTEAQKSTPFEIGLEWAVSLEKPRFVGKRALAEEKARGPARFFVGLEVSFREIERLFSLEELAPQLSNEASRVGVPVYAGDRQVGKATSSGWSPLLKKFLALATLERGLEKPGTAVELEFTVEFVRRRAAARVVALPFFDPERKRSVPA